MVGLAARVWQHAGLAAAHHRGGRQADGAGVDVDRTPSTSPSPGSPPTSRPSTCSGTRARTGRRSTSTTGAPAGEAATRHLQPWGVCASPAAGTSSAATSTAATSGCSGSHGSGRRRRDGQAGRYEDPAGHRPPRDGQRLAPPPPTGRPRAGAHRRGLGAAPPAPVVETGVAGRTATGWDRLELAAGHLDRPTSCSPTAPTWSSRSQPRCATRSSPPARASAGARRDAAQVSAGGAKDQVGRLLRWCRTCTPARAMRLEDAVADLGVPTEQVLVKT